MELTADQLDEYRRDGFVVLGSVLDPGEVATLLAVEAQHRPARPEGLTGPIADSKLVLAEQLADRSEALRRFVTAGPHLDAVAQVLGPDVAFTHTQFIAKLPDAGEVDSFIPLHQDDGYGTLDPPLDCTVWTALHDTDEHNGCLVVIPGSHERGLLDHSPDARNPFLLGVEGDGAVPVPLAAGEAVLFTGLTLHGSGPNRTEQPRVGMHARYCHPSVRMVTKRSKPVLTDRHSWMVRGEAPAPEIAR